MPTREMEQAVYAFIASHIFFILSATDFSMSKWNFDQKMD